VTKKPFHAPFEKLAPLRKAAGARPPPRPAPPRPAPPPPLTEEELWARATAGATPVAAGPDLVSPPAPHKPRSRAGFADLEAADALQSMNQAEPCFDLGGGDALLDGAVAGLDPAVVRRLKRGEYPVERRLDLHGLTREAARGAVERFLRDARQGGLRCVLLIHGRGRHSSAELPVLKEALAGWLADGRFGRQVLAFASARPADGGAGALYILLRRAGR
jgi:DNA-nicking Smr family endonuclease